MRRLRAAGAVIVGKTNTPELGQWPFTEGPAFGDTRNPWNLGHTPGGSSGGGAAAVAAGLVPAALGSDGAGSVRIPAAWTHLVGIKPQRGRISTWPDAESFNGITCNGPLARTVADAALLLHVAAGNRAGRPAPAAGRGRTRSDRPRPRAAADRVVAQARVHRHAEGARSGRTGRRGTGWHERLDGLGHQVAEAEPRYGRWGCSFLPRATAGLADWAGRVPDRLLLDPRTRAAARHGRLLGGGALRLARAAEGPLRRKVGEIFEGRGFDVVLTPTTATPPPRVGAMARLSGWQTDRAMIAACPYAWPWNVVGWPARERAGRVGLMTGCHSAPSCSAAPAASRCSSRWPHSWRMI